MTLRLVAVGGEEKRAAGTSRRSAKRQQGTSEGRAANQRGTDHTELTRLDYDDVLPVRPRVRGRTDS